ncbi:carboxypeptidase regulatory-like domain-containing protein [Candidatus Woesebacteria bacterium]|nr:carboxypeptidase regulatory-like domain-containing protein [Candidatus Woesebacteria bacterium]
MDQHPVPRQITTFEFKLIGFMTLKQFIYIIIFAAIGFIVYKLIPTPIVNILGGVLVGLVGAALAFIPIQDRPLDEWIKNFIKRMRSPTQYRYKKNEESVYFLKDLYFVSDPHLALTHIESKDKLAAYMSEKKAAEEQSLEARRNKKKNHIDDLLKKQGKQPSVEFFQGSKTKQPTAKERLGEQQLQHPYLSGVVKNRKQIPIPGVLVSVRDTNGQQVRLLKTNPHGVFATYSPLQEGDYVFELSDPNTHYFFDTMKLHVGTEKIDSLTFFSKEML